MFTFESIMLAEVKLGLLVMEMLLFLSSLFLIMLVLVQRGKGGGLTGALGGAGGGSAFGAKAGDAFTRITVIVAIFWILLCMVTIGFFNKPPSPNRTLDSGTSGIGADVDGENADGEGISDSDTENTDDTAGTTEGSTSSEASDGPDNSFQPPAETPADPGSETPEENGGN